jgi:hypothetical protein
VQPPTRNALSATDQPISGHTDISPFSCIVLDIGLT